MFHFVKSSQRSLSSLGLLLLVPTATLAFVSAPLHGTFAAAISTSASSPNNSPVESSSIPAGTALCSTTDNTNRETPTTMAKSAPTPVWYQHEISITAPSRGCHLITSQIQNAIKDDIRGIKIGMANLFIMHTSASLTINENADPDVRRDMEVALNKIVPAQWTRDGTFLHTMEGEDDMPGHVKSSLMGPSLNVPIRNGRLALGTWQGIYLNEHRDQGGWGGGHQRNIIITLQGQT
mmetsp:Transcript_30440/g.64123  ORF Transcript_30440/g.64123 Transcript_30440/m.64123 type:complete len:236 (+) Transcript_30440:53-760(+)